MPVTTVAAAATRPHPPGSTHDLTLRSARSARLEGWATSRLRPTLRDASLRDAPQGEVVVLRIAEGETAMGVGTYRTICRNAAGRRRESLQAPRTSSRMHTRSAIRLSQLATTRPRRSAQRVDQGLFALRRGPEKAGHPGKDTTACIAVGNASIAVTGVHKRSRLIDQARRATARHTADVIPHHLLTKGRRS